MSVAPGTRVGPYEVISMLGAGGMGEVYRARDPKLQRDVALKILPEVFASDPDRLARFEREARTLASLNHPHIAGIYGFEESKDVRALALEFVDGETLAERIRRGPIPLDEALPIAAQIAEALEAAHDHGIVHRDLKPANIKITPNGAVKVLDFGLAKLAESPTAPPSSPSLSPTITSPALMTQAGVLLGTAAYMTPEQAKGRPADKRSDIWAFGCVFYEMLTGCRAFSGDDVTDTLAFVITKEPDWSALPLDAPRPALALLRWCLQKQVRHRLRDIGDARLAIDDALTELGADTSVGSRPEGRRSDGRRPLFWVSYAVVALSAVGLTLVAMPRRADVPLVTPKRLVLQLPEGDQLAFGEAAPVGEGRPALAISPDGTRIVYVARHAGTVRLYQRPLDQLDSALIPGTEGAFNPFFSPDGEWVGFFTPTHLKKVAVSGGDPVPLSEARNPYGAAWSRDSVFFAQAFGMILSRVPAVGGVTQVVRSGAAKFLPFAVPGDDALLLSGWPTGLHVVRFNGRDPVERIIAGTYTNPQLTPTGHLIAVRPGQLLAATFDQARWAITGPETLVLNGLRTDSWGGAHFSFSRDGTLVYVRGAPATTGTLVALDLAGGETPLRGFGADNYGAFKLSPSGERLAITVSGATNELWVHDLARGNRTRLNASASSSHPLWTPDGDWVSFGSSTGGPWNIFRQRADGSGELDQLVSSENDQIPYSWSPDGRVLAYTEVHPKTRSDIWVLSETGRQGKPILRSAFNEGQPAISPDGKWLAYVSDESGKSEVYVTSYPAIHGRNPISVDGGEEPIWSRNGHELYYRNGQRWMAVTTSTRQGFEASRPRVLFEGNYLNVSGLSYDVTADGQRFMLIRGLDAPAVREIHVVLNWFEDLKRLVPIK